MGSFINQKFKVMTTNCIAGIFSALRRIRHIPKLIKELNSEAPMFFEPWFIGTIVLVVGIYIGYLLIIKRTQKLN